jgi:hypothetical protein
MRYWEEEEKVRKLFTARGRRRREPENLLKDMGEWKAEMRDIEENKKSTRRKTKTFQIINKTNQEKTVRIEGRTVGRCFFLIPEI